jgi:hypothetical protein
LKKQRASCPPPYHTHMEMEVTLPDEIAMMTLPGVAFFPSKVV